MKFFSSLIASTLGALVAIGIVFFFFFLFFLVIVASTDQVPSVRSGSVLVIQLNGDVPEVISGDPIAQTLGGEAPYSLFELTSALEKAASDHRIDGVWLQIQNVAASWATLEEVRDALLSFKQSGKPIFASSDDYMMTEAEYFLASAADFVSASKQAMFEFNGFHITVEFYKNLLDKLDVEPQLIRAGQYKSAGEPFIRDNLSEENAEQLQALLTTQNRFFMQALAKSRHMTEASLMNIASEEAIISAEQAFDVGLLDSLLYHDEVVSLIKERLGYDMDRDVTTTSIKSYVKVPASKAGLEVNNQGEIAVVYAVGTIMSGSSTSNPILGTLLGAETFMKAMREARENSRVKAVVLRINSPGGSAAASDAMWREIALTAEEKPVIASMGDVAASGGYWIATAADTIVADPLTLTGSIGVFSLVFDLGGLFENKLGITYDAVRTSPYADLFSGVRPLSMQEQRLLQTMTDNTYQTFLEKISHSRGLDIDAIASIGQGRIWIGETAQEIGLVDELGDLNRALAIAAERVGMGEGPYRTRILPRPKTFVEQITTGLSVRAAETWSRLGMSPTERLLLDQARTLHLLTLEHGTVQARLPVNLSIQ